jgi:hypothetical protein
MNGNRWLDRLSQHERLNFLLPIRDAVHGLVQPHVRRLSLAVWLLFGGDLRLDEAERAEFKSCTTARSRARLRGDIRRRT